MKEERLTGMHHVWIQNIAHGMGVYTNRWGWVSVEMDLGVQFAAGEAIPGEGQAGQPLQLRLEEHTLVITG